MPITTPTVTTLYLLPREADQALAALLALLDGAQQSISVAQFQLSHPHIVAALGRAHDRGVAVRILLDHTESCTSVEAKAIQVLCQHIPAQSITVGTSPIKHRFMHCKFVTVDGAITVGGSTNFSTPGFEECQELHVTTSAAYTAAVDQDITDLVSWIEANEKAMQLH